MHPLAGMDDAASLGTATPVEGTPPRISVDVAVMGTMARVVLVGEAAPRLDDVTAELGRLERMWSRLEMADS